MRLTQASTVILRRQQNRRGRAATGGFGGGGDDPNFNAVSGAIFGNDLPACPNGVVVPFAFLVEDTPPVAEGVAGQKIGRLFTAVGDGLLRCRCGGDLPQLEQWFADGRNHNSPVDLSRLI